MSPSSPVACWISSLLRATSRSRCRAPLRPVLTAGPARGQIRTRNGRRWGHRLHSKKTATLSLRYVNAESTPGVHAVHKLGHPLTQNSFPSRRSPGVTGALDMAPMFLSMPARGARWGPSGALSLLVMDSTQPASLWYRGGGVGVSRPLGGCHAGVRGPAERGPSCGDSREPGHFGGTLAPSEGVRVCVPGLPRTIILQPLASCPREPAATSHPGEGCCRQCQSRVYGETQWPLGLRVPSTSRGGEAACLATPERCRPHGLSLPCCLCYWCDTVLCPSWV